MKQAVLSQFDLTWIPLTGLVLFVVCFAAYCYWTFKASNQQAYSRAATLPLQDPAPAQRSNHGK
jgi:cbb3-type cytochrome oxidase subunit 3